MGKKKIPGGSRQFKEQKKKIHTYITLLSNITKKNTIQKEQSENKRNILNIKGRVVEKLFKDVGIYAKKISQKGKEIKKKKKE